MDEPQIKLPEKGREVPVRFVVLHHTGVVPEHFDLMVLLPGEERLATWRLVTPPETWLKDPPAAERIADHRVAYLEFEGSLSGDRGKVKRVGEGMAYLIGTNEKTCLLRFDKLELGELQLPTVRR